MYNQQQKPSNSSNMSLDNPKKIGKMLVPHQLISRRVAELASKIKPSKPISMLWIANGAFYFAADLSRAGGNLHNINSSVSVIRARRYDGMIGGYVTHDVDYIDFDFHRNRHIVLVDDIVDEGETITMVYNKLREGLGDIAEIDVIVLLQKIGVQRASFDTKLSGVGFEIHGNPWVFGYGMDLNDAYRTVPSIWMKTKGDGGMHPSGVSVTVEGQSLDSWRSNR